MKDNLKQIENKKRIKFLVIIVLCAAPIVIGFNFLINSAKLDNFLCIFLDVLLLGVLTAVGYLIYYKVNNKKKLKSKEKKYDPFSDKMV